jgi:hypothetical protein
MDGLAKWVFRIPKFFQHWLSVLILLFSALLLPFGNSLFLGMVKGLHE